MLALNGCGGGGGSSSSPSTGSGTLPLDAGGAGVTLTPLVDPAAGGNPSATFSLAVALNDSNQIVGYAETAAGSEFRAAIWTVDADGGTTAAPSALAPLANHTFSAAFAVDAAGQAVGESRGPLGYSAVIWKTAAATALPPLVGGRGATAFGISPDGSFIVGQAEDLNFNLRAVIWPVDALGNISAPVALPVDVFTRGTPTDPLPSTFSTAGSVNDNGWVVGTVEDGDGTPHAVLWRPSGAAFTTVDLRTGGEESSSAFAINSLGQVAGEAELVAGEFSAVLWADDGTGEFKRATLEGTATASAINDSGRVAGAATAAPLARVWDSTVAPATKVSLFNTESLAYGINAANLVVGFHGSAGFIKKIN